MRNSRGGARTSIAWPLTVLGIVLSYHTAFACSCIDPGRDLPPAAAVQRAVEEADAVFVGIVEEVSGSYPLPTSRGTYHGSERRFQFRVLRSWKGMAEPTTIIRTGSGDGDCGVDFVLGDVYVVYTWRRRADGALWTDICTRTGVLTAASDDSATLGRPWRDWAGGRRLTSYLPGSQCPKHPGSQIRTEETKIVFGLPLRLDDGLRQARAERFPYPGIQVDRPRQDPGRALFRQINRARVCSACRQEALAWCCDHHARCP